MGQLHEKNPLATFGSTKFADWTDAELSVFHNPAFEGYAAGTPCPGSTTACCESPPEPKDLVFLNDPPSAVDWRAKGAVTAVKDQGICGSCWAFATAGTIEGQWAAAGHELKDVSVQEIVSCNVDDLGCQGGRVDTALRWLARTRSGNAVSERDYPYVNSGVAPLCGDNPRMHIAASVEVPHGCKDVPHDEDQMLAVLAEKGPFAVAVDADSWITYKSGIMTDCEAGSVSHGVLVVGYGTEGGQKYWLIKNSWGQRWGEEGYIRLAFGSDQCKITYRPVMAIAKPSANISVFV